MRYTFLKKRTFFEFCVVASLEKQFEGSTESGFRFRQNAAQIAQYLYQDGKLLTPVVCSAELVQTGLYTIWVKQHTLYQTSQDGIKYTKGKEYMLCTTY